MGITVFSRSLYKSVGNVWNGVVSKGLRQPTPTLLALVVLWTFSGCLQLKWIEIFSDCKMLQLVWYHGPYVTPFTHMLLCEIYADLPYTMDQTWHFYVWNLIHENLTKMQVSLHFSWMKFHTRKRHVWSFVTLRVIWLFLWVSVCVKSVTYGPS